MSVEWEDAKGAKSGGGLNRKPPPEQLLLRRFAWPTFLEVTIIFFPSSDKKDGRERKTFSSFFNCYLLGQLVEI